MNVDLDRSHREAEIRSDLFVVEISREAAQNLQLPRRQSLGERRLRPLALVKARAEVVAVNGQPLAPFVDGTNALLKRPRRRRFQDDPSSPETNGFEKVL